MTREAFAGFIARTNLIFVLDHAGRAGNGFFQTIFDRHPQVLTCPWIHYVYSYIITGLGNAEAIDSAKAHAYWVERSYFRFVYKDLDVAMEAEIRRFGGEPEAEIDREQVRRSFDELVLGRPTVTRRDLVAATYFAFAVGRGLDLEAVRYILVTDSISLRTENVMEGFSGEIVDCVTEDYPNAQLIHLVRDPRAGFASSRHQYVNSLGNMYGIHLGNYLARLRRLITLDLDWDSVFVFGFWLMYFYRTFEAAQRAKVRHDSLFTTVRNEDLNLRFEETVRQLGKQLGIDVLPAWAHEPFVPTMLGHPWSGTGAYNSRYQRYQFGPLENDPDEIARRICGPNIYVTERWKQRMGKNETYIVEKLLAPEFAAYGYEAIRYKPGRWEELRFLWELALPMKGELPTLRWILVGRYLGIGEVANRLFFTATFPLFYIAARAVFLYLVLGRRFFAG